MFEIGFEVTNQQLTLVKPLNKLADETANYVRCKFDFKTEDWNGTAKTALFKSQSFGASDTSAIDSNGYCSIPASILNYPGIIVVCVFGIIAGTSYKITTEPAICMHQSDTATYIPNTPVPTPSAYEEFVEQVSEAITAAENIEGKLENMTVSAQASAPGSNPSVQKTATATSFNLHFTLPRGQQGPTGSTGPQGPSGPKGDTGDTGAIGPQGPTGPRGYTGSTGAKGEKGDKGDTGSQGPEGPRGLTGAKGAKGDTGEKGAKGDTGAKGDPGTDGVDGVDGVDGADGAAAGFGTITAEADTNIGVPSVVITASGPDTAKNFHFSFHNIKGYTGERGPQGPAGPGSGDMMRAVYDTDNDGIVNAADAAPWSGITGKPSTFPPDIHNHDDRYYTETEVNTLLTGKAAAVHTHDDRYYTETEVDGFLATKSGTDHLHDGRYYTESEMDSFLAAKLATSLKGAAGGLAELDSNGLVPSSQLPAYVDDVLEYSTFSVFPTVGETGKIYVADDTNICYRWGGSSYVEISSSLALGETSSSAYRGDRGKTAYDHSQVAHAPANAQQNVQSDWNSASGDSFIMNKPTKLSDFNDDLGTSPTHTHSQYGTYTKPTGGIPGTDLAETYYLASNPNGYASGTYSKPSGGIPKSDLANAFVEASVSNKILVLVK